MCFTDKYALITSLVKEDCVKYCEKKYSKEYAQILQGFIPENIVEILNTCGGKKDHRSNLEYARDLILNWIVEDYILEHTDMKDDDLLVKNGTDKERRLLVDSQVASDTDFYGIVGGKPISIELVVNFTNFWHNKNVCHLRENKLNKLIEQSKKNSTYLLMVSLTKKQYQFVKISKKMKSRYIQHHKAFNKPAYEIKIANSDFINFK